MKFIANESARVIDVLFKKLKLSSITKARNLVKEGSVQIDDVVVVRADVVVSKGQCIQIKKAEKKQQIKKAPFELLFEDDYILVALKPAGVLSVNRENENSLTFHKMVNNYVREVSRNKERVFLVHRLDREVSGIMIFAKSLEVQRLLEERWKENDKCYYAICEGIPEKSEDTIESWLAENAALKVYSARKSESAKYAITHYKVLKTWSGRSLIEVRLDTGRKHQIRVHLSDTGCPIIGDAKYGSRTHFHSRIALHSFRLAFFHPMTGERLKFETPMPKEFAL